ncbi:MAG: adenylate/guanylate cyclase domain-containing protein [Chloroflexi bacterium]|nr:adenylate/guanylate cyclase domain-containing protein [Chloroflexota bacterium]
MDAPPIQYARTEDGVNIAYWTLGKGPPLLYLRAVGTGSTAADFAFPPIARMYAELASTYSLLSLDFRNHGHSDHGIEHLALDDFVADIRAIVDATGLSRFAVFATGWSAPVAIRYATRHAAQVSHLILNAPVVQGPHGPTAHDAVTGLWPLDPAAAASAFATAQGLDDPNLMAWLESFLDDPDRERLVEARLRFDVANELPAVVAPALVIHPAQAFAYSGDNETPRWLAAGLADARLIDGSNRVGPYGQLGEAGQLVALVRDFLGPTEPDSARPSPAAVQTLLFTDLESSTELTRSLGDEKAQEVLHGHDKVVRAALESHGGSEVKHTGDGIMASFPSAVGAVAAALQIQRELAGAEVRVRVGLNAGEPIAEDDDFFGLSVIKAYRIADRADPGQVLVSNVVKELCEGKRFAFTSIGEVNLKGFDEAVTLFAVELG